MKWTKDEKGFSLVEVIIVIAMLAILTGTVTYGFAFISGKPAEECAKKMTSQLQRARTDTMGKYKTIVEITKNTEGQVVVNTKVTMLQEDGTQSVSQNTNVVGKAGILVSYEANGIQTEITEANSLSLEFDRGTGALAKTNGSAIMAEQCQRIQLQKNGKVKTITIVPITGNISCD